MAKTNITRRRLLGVASAAAVTVVSRHVLGGQNQTPPSEKLNIAGIGVGGMGGGNLRNLESQNIVALCDVDHAYAAKTFQRYPNAGTYKDYREMLDKQKDIDGVVIATPDHTHAVISMAAIKAGKPAGAGFGYSGPLTEICMLGNVASRMDARIEWDAENLKVTNLPEANKYIRTEYRKGWSL